MQPLSASRYERTIDVTAPAKTKNNTGDVAEY